jgi:3-methyladenine DNA glycosylase AlkD
MDLAAAIEASIRERGDPDRAAHERAYLKSDLEFCGASVPAVESVVRDALRAHPPDDGAAAVALAERLWATRLHERRLAAVEVLVHEARRLEPDALTFVERLLRESRTWALVDPLAVQVVGTIVEAYPETAGVLDRWAADADFWMRRAALLALLGPLRAGGGDFERFGRYADAMLDEREFFIRKAIGWVLRDTARRRPDLVHEWVAPRAARLSGVTYREVVKYLSDAQRAALTAARSRGT